MKKVSRSTLAVAAALLLSITCQTNAFLVKQQAQAVPVRLSSTELEASRRGVLANIRKAAVGIATLEVFRQGPRVARAEDASPSKDGKIVEMTIANVDGVEGNTGKIKIQLRPEWAPRGAQRFQVCYLHAKRSFSYHLQ